MPKKPAPDNPLKMPNRGVIADTLLSVIAERGGSAIPTTIYEVVADRLGLSEAQRSLKLKTGWPLYKNHIQFARQELVSRGYLDPKVKGVWTLTKEGLAATTTSVTTVPALPPNEPLASVELPERLVRAATNSKQPAEFEAVLADAFTFLGFRAKQVGGAGDTDVLLEAPLGRDAYSVVVDGKTSASGKASQFNLLPIVNHRALHKAKHALVVAPGFSGGDLLGYAKEQGIALLTATDLAEVVRLHEESPFSLIELEELFRYHGAPETPLKRLRTAFEGKVKLDELPRILVSRIASLYKMGLVGPVTADALFHHLVSQFREVRYSHETIEATLLVLASPLVGALSKEKAGYSLTMPLQTLEKRFMVLGKRTREDQK